MGMQRRIGFLFFLLMGGLVGAAEYFSLPRLYNVALVIVGLIAIVGGIRVIIKREAYEGRSRLGDPRYVKRHTGVSALLIGVVLLVAGPIIIVLSWIDISSPGGASDFLRGLADSPYGLAAILGAAGLMVTAMGIARARSGTATSSGVYGRHVEFSFKVGGAISALVGLAMLLLAAGMIVAPGLLKELFEQAGHLAKSWVSNR